MKRSVSKGKITVSEDGTIVRRNRVALTVQFVSFCHLFQSHIPHGFAFALYITTILFANDLQL